MITTTTAGTPINSNTILAHDAVNKYAGKAAASVDQLSGSAGRAVETAAGAAHRLVDSAAVGASEAATWMAKQKVTLGERQAELSKACNETIHAHPLKTVGSAFAAGFILALLIRR